MIKELLIQNFQSHKYTILNFEKGINIITGISDSGKSAIIRAINWLCNNKPAGDLFRSEWGGDTVINIEFNNCSITRGRIDKKNYYMDDKIELTSFKFDVPDVIKEKVNINDINLQNQLDSPFLISKGSGEITRYLNNIINLDIIDEINSKVEKSKRDYTNKLEYSREELGRKQIEIKKYDFIIEYENKIKETELFEKKIENISIQIDKIKFNYHNVQIYNNKINSIKSKIEKLKSINNIIQDAEIAIKEIQEIGNIIDKIKNLIYNIKHYKNLINTDSIIFKKYELELKNIMPNICPLCNQEIRNES